MGKIAENILSLSSEEAINYFINTEQYCTFDIPVYFDFTELLNSQKEFYDFTHGLDNNLGSGVVKPIAGALTILGMLF